MIRPVVNDLVDGDMDALIQGVILTACIYGVGALSALGYTQTMVKAAQKVLYDIRRDLFSHLQKLPLRFFDTRRHGDIMSYFTGDVDTISDALNNSFAMLIQSFIQITGTLLLLFILNWRLSLFVVLGYLAMFLYIRYSGRRSKAHYSHQQAIPWASSTAISRKWSAARRSSRSSTTRRRNLKKFRERNEALRKAGEGAQSYAATMVPAVVTISYINYAIVRRLWRIACPQRSWRTVGSLASYLVFVRQAAMPINQFTAQSNFLLAALAGAERVLPGHEPAPGSGRGHGAPRPFGRRQGLGLA